MEPKEKQPNSAVTGIATRIAALQTAQKKDETMLASRDPPPKLKKNTGGGIAAKIALMQQQQLQMQNHSENKVSQKIKIENGSESGSKQNISALKSKLSGLDQVILKGGGGMKRSTFRSKESSSNREGKNNNIDKSVGNDETNEESDGINLSHAIASRPTVCGLRRVVRRPLCLQNIKFSTEL